MVGDYPDFPEAVIRFEAFLRYCGVPDSIHWVAFLDTAWVGGTWFLFPQPPEVAYAAARAKYEAAIPRGLGVKLAPLCRAGNTSFCYVYRPSNRTEAEHLLMPDGLKLSVWDKIGEGKIVADARGWEELKAQEENPRLKRSWFH